MSKVQVILRLLLAIVIGGAIGYEREFKNRPAGLRTNILVCVGAAVVSMIQVKTIEDISRIVQSSPVLEDALKADVGRMGAQVISGIGFLGAGTIMHEKGSVKGLTTAASLWVVACIGLGIGLGYYYLTIMCALIVIVVLVTLKRFEDRFLDKEKVVKLKIEYSNKSEMVNTVIGYFDALNITVESIEFSLEEEISCRSCSFTIHVPRHINKGEILKNLGQKKEIIKMKIV